MDKISWWMHIAETTAKKSHDAETKVGAILINTKTGAILASGYNGFVRGAPDDSLPNNRPDKYDYMIHAEQNLICNCARHGISMNDCIVVCTMSPCARCMRYLWQCGITTIICKELYKDIHHIESMKDLIVLIDNIDVKDEIFYKIVYSSPVPQYQEDRVII